MAAFQTLLGLGSAQPPTTYREIISRAGQDHPLSINLN